MQGFAADPVYAKGEVFAYVGLPQNLKYLNDGCAGAGDPASGAGGSPLPPGPHRDHDGLAAVIHFG